MELERKHETIFFFQTFQHFALIEEQQTVVMN